MKGLKSKLKSWVRGQMVKAARQAREGLHEYGVEGDCGLGLRSDVDLLFECLYHAVHDLDHSLDMAAALTAERFEFQWEKMKQGRFLLSDPWFRDNVARIIAEEELQIKREWFRGKRVLDAGCGNGRWSYGLAQLGANITAVDISRTAIEETKSILDHIPVQASYYVHPLETLSTILKEKSFDLVWTWGVLHHTRSFNNSLRELLKLVRPDGVFYAYIYGRESMNLQDDLKLFKERLRFNFLKTPAEQMKFLLAKAGGDREKVHNMHDIYAPLVNRRLDYQYVESFLKQSGFEDICRTIDHSEIFVRAIGKNAEFKEEWCLPKAAPPFWFQRFA